jgi:hypothetical protein
MERYALVQQVDSIVKTVVAPSPGMSWHCDDDCFPVLLNTGEACEMGWQYEPGMQPRFAP